ncbi:hypothetical protein BS47DRAFT_1360442 [Hydnum rufescens UP504]|uniref:Uncharacterized protein n=1 Tax=Hydnum rufescens UP504 TaxID=1448309 RepID=A0A9P6B2G5_9AGAM|nr:hypothetical protein BS47DRAFT_1360442 [Hydnum rufescens UP504]
MKMLIRPYDASTYEKKIAENVTWNKSLLESLGLGRGNPLGIPEIVTHKGHHAKVSKAPDSEDYVLMIPELEQDHVHMDGYNNNNNDYNDKSDSNSNSDNNQGYDHDGNDGNTDHCGHGSNDMYTQENKGNIVGISSSVHGPLAHTRLKFLKVLPVILIMQMMATLAPVLPMLYYHPCHINFSGSLHLLS